MHINRLSGLLTLEHATYNCPWEKQSVFRSIPHYSNDVSLCPDRHLYSLCPGRLLCPGVPVCNFSECPGRHLYSLCPVVPVVICVPVSRSVISIRTIPVSRSSFIYPACAPGVPVVVVSLCPGRHLYSLCPGRDLCPGVPVSNFSLRFQVITYIPSVSVVICVPVGNFSLSVFSF